MTKAKDLAAELLEIGEQNKELLVELRQERKALKEAIKEAKEAKEELKTTIASVLDSENVVGVVKQGLDELQDKIERVSEIKTQQISDMFDKLGNLFMYGNQQGRGENLQTLVLNRRAEEQQRMELLHRLDEKLEGK